MGRDTSRPAISSSACRACARASSGVSETTQWRMGSYLASRDRYSSVSSDGLTWRVSTSLARCVTGRKASASSVDGLETSGARRIRPRGPDGSTLPGGTGLNTIAGCSSSRRLAARKAANPAMCPRGSIEARQDRLLFCSCEGDTGDLLRGLEHVDGDDVGVLRGDGEGIGHEGRAEAHRRQAREEMPPVERDSLFVHTALAIMALSSGERYGRRGVGVMTPPGRMIYSSGLRPGGGIAPTTRERYASWPWPCGCSAR